MDFKFKKRKATFEVFKNRKKKPGGDKTITITVRHSVSPKEMDMLIPVGTEESVPISQFLFGGDLRKPQLQTYVLFPINVNRNPEGISIKIHDKAKDPLVFEEVDITDIKVDIDEDNKKMLLSYDLQLHPGRYLQRISDYVEDQTLDYECVNTQEELFGEEPEKGGGTQVDADDPPPVTTGDGINDEGDDD